LIYLVEHFFSIQGEGRHSGVPSIFIRFGGCNLRCPGFGTYTFDEICVRGCDTIRAVDRKRFKSRWQEIVTSETLIAIIRRYLEPIDYRPHVVITGGEPMLYADNPIFYGFIRWLADERFHITIETNATLAPSFEKFPAYNEVTFVMAVKLSNSGEPKKKRLVPDAIQRLAEEGKHSFFKFTLDRALIDKDAASQIKEICAAYHNDVYCMPLGETLEAVQNHAAAVAEFCLRQGYIYSDRLHVRLWNRQEKR